MCLLCYGNNLYSTDNALLKKVFELAFMNNFQQQKFYTFKSILTFFKSFKFLSLRKYRILF